MAIKVSENRRSGIAVVGLACKVNAAQRVSDAATYEVGVGAPAHSAANGSMYVRTDATTADNVVYARVGGSWLALKGAT